MRKLREVAPENSTMVESLVKRASDKHIGGDWQKRAENIVTANVYPALDRQIAVLEALKPTSRPGDGAWRIPNGDAIYAEALRQATTTNFSPAEVHQMGLAQVADISSQIDAILKPDQWIKLINRLGEIYNPTVPTDPSKYSLKDNATSGD